MARKTRSGARRRGQRKLAEAELEGEELTVAEPPRRIQALTEAERQDDFEDGRTQGGLYSRDEEDLAARGDEGSRRRDVRSGPLSVEAGEPETAAPARPKPDFRRPPSEGAPYVPPGGLARIRRRSKPAKSRARRRRAPSRPSFAR